MTALYTLLITRLIAWLHGLSRTDFDAALKWVREFATRDDMTGSDKAKAVANQMLSWLNSEGREIGGAALNVLIELAVSYARRVK